MFLTVISILFCYSWFCSLENGDKELWGWRQKEETTSSWWGKRQKEQEIITFEHHHLEERSLSPPLLTGVWQNMWRRINRAPPVLGTSTSSSHWGWQKEDGSACTSRNQGNGKSFIFKGKGLHWCRKHLFVRSFHLKTKMQFLTYLACSWQPLLI